MKFWIFSTAEAAIFAGYLPDWRLSEVDFDILFNESSPYTHVFLFSCEIGVLGTLEFVDRFEVEEDRIPRRVFDDYFSFLKPKRKKNLKVMLVLGGIERSEAFSEGLSRRSRRETLVKQVKGFSDNVLPIDGIDLIYASNFEKDDDEFEDQIKFIGNLKEDLGNDFLVSFSFYNGERVPESMFKTADFFSNTEYSYLFDLRELYIPWKYRHKTLLGVPFFGYDYDKPDYIFMRDVPDYLRNGTTQAKLFLNHEERVKRAKALISEQLLGFSVWEIGMDTRVLRYSKRILKLWREEHFREREYELGI